MRLDAHLGGKHCDRAERTNGCQGLEMYRSLRAFGKDSLALAGLMLLLPVEQHGVGEGGKRREEDEEEKMNCFGECPGLLSQPLRVRMLTTKRRKKTGQSMGIFLAVVRFCDLVLLCGRSVFRSGLL